MGKKVKISDLVYDKTPRIVGIPGADIKAKVSADDTTPGYLNGKLVEGANVDFTENNPGLNETLTIAVNNPVVANVTGNCSGSSGSCTGNAATVTTNANLTGPITSVGNATSIASQTGTGTKFVVDTSPTIVTPTVASFLNANHTHAAAGATGGTVHHGDTTGLTDDDHTIYTKKATLTEQGDLYSASAASTPAALVHGITGEILISGGHGANPSWAGAINLTGDSSIAADKKILLEGAGSDSYLIYNSTTKKVELYVDGILVNSWGNNGLKMLMDGSTAIKDLITPPSTAFTMTGGVAGSFADATNGNFQLPISTGLLGAQAPVIAQAVDNLLTDNNASFETSVAGWGASDTNCSIASDATQYFHGVKSLKMTITANGYGATATDIAALVSSSNTFTASCKFKGVVGRTYKIRIQDNGAATDGAAVTGDGTWQTLTVTKTITAGLVWAYLKVQEWVDALAGDITYIDAVQLEAGSVQTPFALDTRTACTMTIPTATIGLVAGTLSFAFVVNTPWVGNDGVAHWLLQIGNYGATNTLTVWKSSGNNLVLYVFDNAGAVKARQRAIDATSWAANTNHIVIATVTPAGVLKLYLDGSETGMTDAGAGTGILSAMGTTLYLGTDNAGTNPLNGAILCAIWGRVLSAAEIATISAWTLWTSATTCGPAIGSTYFDDVNDRFYVYTSNGWRYAALT